MPGQNAADFEVEVPWGVVAGKTYGSESGHPVLTVHEWEDNLATFDKLAPLLADNLYVVAIDLPGHGKSSHFPRGIPYHHVDCVGVIKRVVDFFKWKSFSVMGHGVGGGLLEIYAATFPKGVHSIVLLDSFKPLSAPILGRGPQIAATMDLYIELEQKAKMTNEEDAATTFEQLVRSTVEARKSALNEEQAEPIVKRGSRAVSDDKWVSTTDPLVSLPDDTLRFTHDQCFGVLRLLKFPLLIVRGGSKFTGLEAEAVSQAEQALAIYKEVCPIYDLVEVEGGHYVHLTQPEDVASRVNAFFKKAGI